MFGLESAMEKTTIHRLIFEDAINANQAFKQVVFT